MFFEAAFSSLRISGFFQDFLGILTLFGVLEYGRLRFIKLNVFMFWSTPSSLAAASLSSLNHSRRRKQALPLCRAAFRKSTRGNAEVTLTLSFQFTRLRRRLSDSLFTKLERLSQRKRRRRRFLNDPSKQRWIHHQADSDRRRRPETETSFHKTLFSVRGDGWGAGWKWDRRGRGGGEGGGAARRGGAGGDEWEDETWRVTDAATLLKEE